MPDRRTHRGANPEDGKLFAAEKISTLRESLEDYSLLLTRGYAEHSALKLVGDKFELNQRQRIAIMRAACSDQQLASRRKNQLNAESVSGKSLAIDGYNLLITTEAALAGAPIFICRDGCYRDICGLHGTYKRVQETIPAAKIIGEYLAKLQLSQIKWFFDSPVSNSGRLKITLLEFAEQNNWNWQIELSVNPDKELVCEEYSDFVVASSDSIVLDGCRQWLNLAKIIVENEVRNAWVIDLSNKENENE